jgi:molybdate transport system regulatory protein
VTDHVRFKLRLTLPGKHPLGPGKAELMRLIESHGSISAAGAAMNMSYRRAWLLIDELNSMFRQPVVLKSQGGAHGGGASLSEFGAELLKRYERMEKQALAAVSADIDWIEQELAPPKDDDGV